MKRHLHPIIIIACLTIPLIAFAGSKRTPPPELVGTWSGSAEIFGPFKAEPYPSKHPDDIQKVTITIAADGTVTGEVGNAVMHNARFMKNRGKIGRKLNINTDYIVYGGTLQGKVSPRDSGTDCKFTIPFNVIGEELEAAVMIVSPKRPLIPRLTLRKQGPPNK